MKAIPVRNIDGVFYKQVQPEDCTHVRLNIPGPTGNLMLPVILKGKREGTGSWTWNGDVDKPTLKPSVKTTGHNFLCHSFINDGEVKFLADCTHDMANTTVELLDVE